MTRTIEEAIAWGMAESVNRHRDWTNLCKVFARECYAIASDGTPSAAQAWRNAHFQHAWTDTAPRGALVFGTGGSDGNGHVVISLGGGYAISTDAIRRGWPDVIHYPTLWAHWSSLDRSGWTEDVDGVRFMGGDTGQGGGTQLGDFDMATLDELTAIIRKELGTADQGGTVKGDLQYIKGGLNARAAEIAQLRSALIELATADDTIERAVDVILQRLGSRDAGGTVLGDTQYIKEGVNAVNAKLDG